MKKSFFFFSYCVCSPCQQYRGLNGFMYLKHQLDKTKQNTVLHTTYCMDIWAVGTWPLIPRRSRFVWCVCVWVWKISVLLRAVLRILFVIFFFLSRSHYFFVSQKITPIIFFFLHSQMCELIKNKDTILREVSSQMDDQLPIVFWTSSAEIKILKKKATGKKKKKKKINDNDDH